ncbi:MAG: galactitol-1-phosphate 5-dehydrogenase [Spirochaetia bacterium]
MSYYERMNATMNALVLEEDARLAYREVSFPERPGQEWALLKVAGSGICGSDIQRGFEGKSYLYPLIMGHEFSAVVEEPGSSGEYSRGDRVTAFPLLPCYRCIPCQSGEYAQCTDYDYLGSRRDGAFAEYVYVPEKNLFRLPDHVDLVHAAMTEPAAVALHGVGRLEIDPGYTAAVYGAGPIGNMVAQWLRISGCRQVILIDIDRRKIALAREMGFDTVDSKENDPVEAVHELTRGYGADCVVESCGLPVTFLQAVKSTGRGGQTVFLGNIVGTFSIGEKDFSNILRKEIVIRGTWNSKVTPKGKDDWSTVLEYMDRELDVASLISHTPPLSEGKEMFQAAVDKSEYVNKVIFDLTSGK